MNDVSLNKFHKGIVSDLDYAAVPNDKWVFPSSGVRVINVPGKGFVASLANGTEFLLCLEGKVIQPIPGYADPYIVASKEYKGILYLVIVYNRRGMNWTEIGTFHSPRQFIKGPDSYGIDPELSGFKPEYLPLLTVSDKEGRRKPLISKGFGYHKNSTVNLLVKESYDGSVDLYLCDGVNFNYVVNSGFDQLGSVTQRTVSYEDLQNGNVFSGEFLQVRGIVDYPERTELMQTRDGFLKYGIYYFFIRYVSESLDRTGFVSEVGPIQIGQGSYLHDLEGGNATEHSSKTVIVEVEKYDSMYKYVELAYMRYYGELGYSVFESFLINKKYDTGNNKIVVTGYEQLVPINTGEIFRIGIYERKCLYHLVFQKRYIGLNWIGQSYDFHKYAELFLKIRPTITGMFSKRMYDPDYWDYRKSSANISPGEEFFRYKDFGEVLDFVGYYRGEIYCFGVVALLNDGTVTEQFPIKGGFFDSAKKEFVCDNDLGVIKFPEYEDSNCVSEIANQEFIMGLSLNFDDFNNALSDPLYSEIKGFYIVRGDRLSNLLCQGIMYPASNGKKTHGEPVFAPIVGAPPLIKKTTGSDDLHPGDNFTYYTTGALAEINRNIQVKDLTWAVFAPDHIFDFAKLSQQTKNVSVKILARFDDHQSVNKVRRYFAGRHFRNNPDPNDRTFCPKKFLEDVRGMKHTNVLSAKANVSMIRENEVPRNIGGKLWGSYLDRGVYINNANNPADLRIWNRKMRFPRYIAVSFDTAISGLSWQSPMATFGARYLVNIYKSNSDVSDLYTSILSSFVPHTMKYRKISGLVKVKDIESTRVLYKGDCFMQRVGFRVLHWHDFQDGDGWPNWVDIKDVGGHSTKYSHGMVSSFCCESSVNVGMRDADQNTETYYPKIAGKTIEWVFNTFSQWINEAFYYNHGYHQVLSSFSFRGYDPVTSFRVNKYPARMRHSAESHPGQIYDAWRIFDILGYKDYDVLQGAFTGAFEILGALCSIQEKAINRHFTEDKKLAVTGTSSEIVLGSTGFLSEEMERIVEFGMQHSKAFVKSVDGVYGVDYDKKVLWFASVGLTGFGNRRVDVVNLAESKFVNTGLNKFLRILDNERQLPYENNGILLGWDNKNKEIHLSVLPNEETFVFNETLSEFTGMLPYYSQHYIQHQDGLISVLKGKQEDAMDSIDLFLHLPEDIEQNIKTPFQRNNTVKFTLSWVVNGGGEQGRDILIKTYESIEIESLNVLFKDFIFKTQNQSAFMSFLSQHPLGPGAEYAEGVWVVPLPTASQGLEPFSEGSNLNGTYLVASLSYEDGEKNQFVRHVKTFFNRSFY